MKKKLVMVLLATTLIVSACGNDAGQVSQQSQPSPTESANTTNDSTDSDNDIKNGDLSDLDALGDIEVEENLFTVELTIPADFVGEVTQEELDAAAQEYGYQVTLNDDGSATYIMTKAQHEKMLADLAENINASLSEMIGSETYPNITDIKANSNFTEFTVTTKSTELDMVEAFSVMGFYIYSGMYNVFTGEDVDNVHVDFVNADSGEIISASDSSDIG